MLKTNHFYLQASPLNAVFSCELSSVSALPQAHSPISVLGLCIFLREQALQKVAAIQVLGDQINNIL